MKKIILITLITMACAFVQAQTKMPNGVNIQGKSLTGAKITSYDAAVVKVNDNVNNENYFVLKGDSITKYVTPKQMATYVSQNSLVGSLLTGLKCYFNFNEASGTFTDASLAKVGTGTSVIYEATGKLGRAVGFDAASDRIEVPFSSPMALGTNSITISAWVYPSSGIGRDQFIAEFKAPDYTLVNRFKIRSDNRVSFSTYNTSSVSTETTSVVAVAANAWSHIVVIQTPEYSKVYINGTESTTLSNTVVDIRVMGYLIYIGNDGGNVSAPIGKIDEFSYWNRAITPLEVGILYNVGLGKTYPF